MAGPHDDTPIESMEDLLAPFHQAETPRAHFRVGTEAEKFGVFADGTALPYEAGERGFGVTTALTRLRDQFGWTPKREYDDGPLIALVREEKNGKASITLEPGGQLELSGATQRTIHETCEEFRTHMTELRAVSADHDVRWLGVGYHPLAAQADLPWVPKLRYGVMREYLPTKGSRALDMMRRTATVQANYDFIDEVDAVRKMRIGLALSPITTAMFANSPFSERTADGTRSHRAAVWLDVDPDRSGMLPFAFEDGFSYQRYVEWALDAPMFLIVRGSETHPNTGQPFREFLKDGFRGVHATMGDWTTHLNTLFPEVRLKNTIEVRGVDNQNTSLVCALPALYSGIFHDEEALVAAERFASSLAPDELIAARQDLPALGLKAKVGTRELSELAVEVFEIAKAGLARQANLNDDGQDETIHLAALERLVRAGQCPADALLGEVSNEALDAQSIIALTEMTASH